jgi:hypothetical protein
MKKIRLIECVFLLLILCACTTQPAMQPESKNPITEVPEQAESQSTALAFRNSESREQAEVQDSQSENPAQAAFTGGITLYADSRTAYVNSEPVEMPAAPFVENGNFYIPLQFVAETMGWSYQEQSGTVALASSSHQTTLTVGTRTIRVDDDETTVNSYDWQFPEEGAESDPYVPLIRDEIVFIPLDFLETRTDRDILSKLSFRTQWFPEERYAILSADGKEEGFCGFYLWDHYDDLPEAQRAGMEELGIVGFSRDAYDVVEYGTNGLFVHVLRLRDGCEDMDRLDGVISSVYTTNPDIPTLRGLRVGEEISRIYTTYDGNFFMELLCLTEGDVITQIRFRCAYYDDDERIRVQPTCLHMDTEIAAGQNGLLPFE